MGDAIVDTLLFTLADIHANADVTFNLDSAIRVLESAHASLDRASSEEKRRVVERAMALSAESSDAGFITFLGALVEHLTDDADSE